MTTRAERCTWDGCTDIAAVAQVASDGEQWANLCETHNQAINSAIDRRDAKALLAGWVKAQGGAKAATRRMLQ